MWCKCMVIQCECIHCQHYQKFNIKLNAKHIVSNLEMQIKWCPFECGSFPCTNEIQKNLLHVYHDYTWSGRSADAKYEHSQTRYRTLNER